MKITQEELVRVAELARLALTPQEQAQLVEQLGHILDYVEKLNQLNTTGVAPTSHVVPLFNVFREDQQKPSLTSEEALANAPEQAVGAFFRVPKIIEER